jgi:hypothetical protein
MTGSVKDYVVAPVELKKIKSFVENWHYSKSVNGLHANYCFGLFDGDKLIGAMIYGSLGMANAWKKYGEKESDVIELRRLCCIDDTPKNTESYFIGKTIKWLKKNTDYKIIVSYADTFHGHSGTIYKASNFRHVGFTAKGKKILYENKTYHDKSIRTYYVNAKGEKVLKPFAKRIKDALDNGTAHYIDTGSKHIFVYSLE